MSRFVNADIGIRQIDATIPDGVDLWRLRGWFDYSQGRGYASLWSDGADAAAALLLWSQHYLLSSDGGGLPAGELPPLPLPGSLADPSASDEEWKQTDYAPAEHVPHVALRIIASLGSDRPENPLLLRQSDALWLRTDDVDGAEVNVFTGPRSDVAVTATSNPNPDAATVRYWLDQTGRMYRVEMRLGAAWGTVDFLDRGGAPIAIPEPTDTDAGHAAKQERNSSD